MIRTLILFLLILFKTEAQTSVLNVADSLYLSGNYTRAIEHYKIYTNQSEVFDKMAKAYVAIGNYDEALKNYEASIEVNPKDALLKFEFARLLSKTKNFETAALVFNELVRIDYKNPNYHYELGLVLEQLNDSTAQNRFHSAFQLDTTHQKAIFKIAKHYLIKGANTQADKYIDIGLSSYENNKELISLKAQNFYLRNQYEKAIVWFEKLLALNESSQFIHEKLSFAYSKVLNYEDAIIQMQKALAYDSKNTANLYALGKLYERVDDFVNAEKYINEFLILKDEALDNEYMFLGQVLNRQKKYKEAIEAYQKAIRENPTSNRTNFYLVFTKDQYYKDVDTRIKLYEQYKEQFPESGFIRMVDHRIAQLKKEKFLKPN